MRVVREWLLSRYVRWRAYVYIEVREKREQGVWMCRSETREYNYVGSGCKCSTRAKIWGNKGNKKGNANYKHAWVDESQEN